MNARKIANPVTGQSIEFIKTSAETGGNLLELHSTYLSKSIEPVAHYHPAQNEHFKVKEGKLNIRFADGVIILGKDEEITIPAGKVHSMWNDTNEKTVVNWKISPALNSESFFREAFSYAEQGKVNSKGVPGLLQVSLMIPRYSTEIVLAKPPLFIQKFIFGLLRPIAMVLGYK